MIGKYFLDKCITSETLNDPWCHQMIQDTLPQEDFDTLKNQCENLDVPKDKLFHLHPVSYHYISSTDYTFRYHYHRYPFSVGMCCR